MTAGPRSGGRTVMMTGAAGVVIWLMMGLMVAAMGGGAIAWARRRMRRPIMRDESLSAVPHDLH